jgi:subtilisin
MRFFHLIRLFFYFVSLLSFMRPTYALGAFASLVTQDLAQKAQTEGAIRVIVRLGSVLPPETWVESDIELANRRSYIDFARLSTRTSLAGVAHQIIREYEDFPYIALRVGPEGLRVLDSLRGIVTEIFEDELNAPSLAESVPLVQADRAWTGDFAGNALDGSGTVVAIVDTGVDKDHPFLGGKVIEEACFSSNDNDPNLLATSVCPGGVETSLDAGSGVQCGIPVDCEHGTHVAGIATGNGQSGAVAAFSGVAKGADIMAVQVFTKFNGVICLFMGLPTPCALAFTSDIMAGLDRIYSLRTQHNFAAVNMSIGGQLSTKPCNTDPRKSIIDSLRAANIATVVSSGNDAVKNAIAAPACISSAVSVGSTGDGSGGSTADAVSSFSNSASFLSLLAPGEWITSSIPGGGFDTFRGTSMAAPHVAGAFAILKQAAPSTTVSQMLATLQTSGLPVTDPTNSITKSRIKIVDALENLPSVQFSSATYSVAENARRVRITVTRSGVATDTLRVNYATSDGTATAGTDYTAKSGTLIFSARQKTKKITIPITNDTVFEPDETINLTLSNPVGGLLGAQSTAVLTIIDNDGPGPGSIQFDSGSYTVNESARRATVTVIRSGGSVGTVTVNYSTSNGTATAGVDYTARSGTLSFASGKVVKTFTIPIINDSIDEPDETVNLTLSNPTGGASLGAQNTAILTIPDNDL